MSKIKKIENAHYNFSCYVVKYGRESINGLIYQKDSLKSCDGVKVPLLWNHTHNDNSAILGSAFLKNLDDGVYAYGIIRDGFDKGLLESLYISPFVKNVKYDKKYITHGEIGEVSLVCDRVDPDNSYRPVMIEDES